MNVRDTLDRYEGRAANGKIAIAPATYAYFAFRV
jgi:hypothetical protein